MKTQRTLATLWLAAFIAGPCFWLWQFLLKSAPAYDGIHAHLSLVCLFGIVACIFLLRGARWARISIGIIALYIGVRELYKELLPQGWMRIDKLADDATFVLSLVTAVLLFFRKYEPADLAVSLAGGCSAAHALRWPHASIRALLLKHTAPGTSKAQVEIFIEKGWHICHNGPAFSWLDWAAKQGGGPHVPERVHSVLWTELGGHAILIGTRYVYGLWAFDDKGSLIDVWVFKQNDVL